MAQSLYPLRLGLVLDHQRSSHLMIEMKNYTKNDYGKMVGKSSVINIPVLFMYSFKDKQTKKNDFFFKKKRKKTPAVHISEALGN